MGKDMREPVVVLHLIGAGRSGSTLLNIMLDNHPAIIGTGEMTFLARSSLRGDFCSCGRPLRECSFWKRVQDEWLRRTGMESMREYLSLQRSFERYRRLPLIYLQSIRPSSGFQRYCDCTRQLFEVIQEVSGATFIADSSKHPARVLALSAVPGIDLRVVFLVRDLRGYAWSMKKAFDKDRRAGLNRTIKPMPIWRTALQWQITNLISEWVLKRVERWTVIRYEDLIHVTEQAFFQIGSLMGLDLSLLVEAIIGGRELEIEHIAAGNRLRMQKAIVLRRDEGWRSQMPDKDRRTSWMLAGWLMKRYGYRRANGG